MTTEPQYTWHVYQDQCPCSPDCWRWGWVLREDRGGRGSIWGPFLYRETAEEIRRERRDMFEQMRAATLERLSTTLREDSRDD